MTDTGRSPRRRLTRPWVLALCIPSVALAWAAVRVYQLSRDPAAANGAAPPWTAVLAPDADALENAAVSRLKAALARLNDGDLEPAERLAAYRRELAVAQSLLQQSLRANPMQPAALARLAAVRWEIEPQDSTSGRNDILRMIATASSLAARVPEVQSELGALLLRLGRTDEAIPYFARAVTLDPRVAGAAVAAMYEGGIEPARVAASLPAVPDVLVALRPLYVTAGQSARYIEVLERTLPEAPDTVLRAYVDVCIELQQASRAFDALQSLSPAGNDELAAARLMHTSRAARNSHHGDIAVSLARRARDLSPNSPVVLEELGLAFLAAGDPAQAVRSIREAIAAAAAANAPGPFLASLYGNLGGAEERAGHPDRAYDEYRRSLQLDPGGTYPRQRLDAMRRSAGTSEP